MPGVRDHGFSPSSEYFAPRRLNPIGHPKLVVVRLLNPNAPKYLNVSGAGGLGVSPQPRSMIVRFH